MKKSIILSALALSMTLVSCDDLFEPAIENNLGMEYMYNNPSYAEGVLGNAYTRLLNVNGSYPFSEVATDDAVSNDATNPWRKMASGTWTSNNNPADTWTTCRSAIQYLNLFLANADKVKWAEDEVAAKLYNDREKGEAYGLRALYMYYLLRAHGGYGNDGVLYGVPIITEPEDKNSDFNKPRNTFAECVQAINEDCEKALELLPAEYGAISSADQIPAKYRSEGVTVSQYNRVFGDNFQGRMCGKYVEAYRAKASLLAASPAYAASGVTYQTAADNFAKVLDRINGVAGLDPTGNTWYCNTKEITGLQGAECPKEIMWRTEKSNNKDLEADNYPPSIYGKGRINPTQNFVDAFPMADGYPITDANSGYSAQDPYSGRDPRLALYVVLNGSKQGPGDGTTITTAVDGTNQDALNNLTGSSTRTGYYLRKLLRSDVNLSPTSTTTQYHYNARIRYTEMFLDYAEAANEAYGPKIDGGHGYSAYDVIKAIRDRAGLGDLGEDGYLEECAQSKEKMRELIRNERRIELSFEGFRFWDLRRWNLNLNEKAKGMSINAANNTYTPIDVDIREYKDYMNYGPIPYTECLKFDQLQQNKGW